MVVLSHKPAQLAAVAHQISGYVKAVASVLGGVTIESLRAAYPLVPVFRLMPNTPVEVRRGVICYAEPADDAARWPHEDPELEDEVLALFARLGTVVKVPERLIDTAAAVMSVGPAYQALIAEAQVDAAVRQGLGSPLAGRLVAETMSGTAAMLVARDYDTLAVRREVTSPAGIDGSGPRGARAGRRPGRVRRRDRRRPLVEQ